MARIRSLKPSFFKNEDLTSLSFAHRLCYQGLWCYADRDGRLEDRPKRLKAEIFPYDDVDMDRLLSDLCAAGFIRRYRSGTVAVIWIPTFEKHQVPKRDERPSGLPAYVSSDSDGAAAEQSLDRGGTAVVPPVGQGTGEGRTEDRSQGTGEGRDLLGAVAPPQPVVVRTPADLQSLWNAVTTEPIGRCRDLTPKRIKHASVRLRERSFEEWRSVFERIEASPFCRGANDRNWLASFDWIIESPDSSVKVLEGKYDDRRSQRRERATVARQTVSGCDHTPACSTTQECYQKPSGAKAAVS